jgi:hypothetical protein
VGTTLTSFRNSFHTSVPKSGMATTSGTIRAWHPPTGTGIAGLVLRKGRGCTAAGATFAGYAVDAEFAVDGAAPHLSQREPRGVPRLSAIITKPTHLVAEVNIYTRMS